MEWLSLLGGGGEGNVSEGEFAGGEWGKVFGKSQVMDFVVVMVDRMELNG